MEEGQRAQIQSGDATAAAAAAADDAANANTNYCPLYYHYSSKTYIPLRADQAARLIAQQQVAVPTHTADTLSDDMAKLANPKRRSRGGCLTCRKRKKRCSEHKPSCYECTRLEMPCQWPEPGSERKNRRRNIDLQPDEIFHETYGVIKVLRGIVQYRINETP